MINLIFIFYSFVAQADCIIWKIAPTAADKNGCVGWTWISIPPSATNCPPPTSSTNPIARPITPADPQDCIYKNNGGHVINLCK